MPALLSSATVFQTHITHSRMVAITTNASFVYAFWSFESYGMLFQALHWCVALLNEAKFKWIHWSENNIFYSVYHSRLCCAL